LSPAIAQAPPVERPLTKIETLPGNTRSTLKPALEAAFGFRLDDGVDCTGTYVSRSGHFITALHCIADCLAKSGALDREPAMEKPTSIEIRASSDESVKLRPIFTYKYTIDESRIGP